MAANVSKRVRHGSGFARQRLRRSTLTSMRSTPVDQLLLEVLPAQGTWHEDEYLWLTDRTSRFIEFSAGKLEVLPMPTDEHQRVLKFLFRIFDALMEQTGGTVLFAVLRLRLPNGRFREPDLLLLCDAHDPRRRNRFWTGADLVLEVVSPDDPQRDTVLKRREYARAGIPEYWIVNPLEATITVLTLDRTKYAVHGVFERGSQATSVLLPGLAVAVDAVFDAQ